MKKSVLMSSATEEGLLKLMEACWLGQGTRLVGDKWPKSVYGRVNRLKGLEAVKKGKIHVRYQIVRVCV